MKAKPEPGVEAKMSAGKPVGAVVSALRVLRRLAQSPEPLPSNRIARELSLNPSTCFNILKTLEHEGFVHCDPQTKRHSPGLMLLELAGGAMSNMGFRQMLHPQLEQIARSRRVLSALFVRSGYDKAVLVDSADGGGASGPIKLVMPIGTRVPLFAGALGRCFAAHGDFSRAEARKLFQRVRWHAAPSFDAFMEQAAACARAGYAVDNQNFASGIVTISAPILDGDDRPIMALSAVTLASAVDAAGIAAIGAALAEAAEVARRANVAVGQAD